MIGKGIEHFMGQSSKDAFEEFKKTEKAPSVDEVSGEQESASFTLHLLGWRSESVSIVGDASLDGEVRVVEGHDECTVRTENGLFRIQPVGSDYDYVEIHVPASGNIVVDVAGDAEIAVRAFRGDVSVTASADSEVDVESCRNASISTSGCSEVRLSSVKGTLSVLAVGDSEVAVSTLEGEGFCRVETAGAAEVYVSGGSVKGDLEVSTSGSSEVSIKATVSGDFRGASKGDSEIWVKRVIGDSDVVSYGDSEISVG